MKKHEKNNAKKVKTVRDEDQLRKLPDAKKAKMDCDEDQLRKLPDDIVKFIFRSFFKPPELASVKQAAHRYNKLGKEIELQAQAVLLAQFDDEVKALEHEAAEFANKLPSYFHGTITDDNGKEFDSVAFAIREIINDAKKYITCKNFYHRRRLIQSFEEKLNEWLKEDYTESLRYAEKEPLLEYIHNVDSITVLLDEYLYEMDSVLEKLADLAQTYRHHYYDLTLQQSQISSISISSNSR